MYLTREEALARDANRMAILRHVCLHPGACRRDLAQALELPRTSIASLITGLLEEGWLEKREVPPSGRRGRTPVGLHAKPDRLVLLGVEISADGLRVAASTLGGELLAADEVAHEPGTPTLATAAKLLVRMQARVYSPDRRVMGIGLSADTVDRQAPAFAGEASALLQTLGEHLRGTSLRRVPLHTMDNAPIATLGELALPKLDVQALPQRQAAEAPARRRLAHPLPAATLAA